MTRLTLIRHGRTAWNNAGLIQGSSDVPLDDVGREQARAAAIVLLNSGTTWDSIVSSPLLRARETAAIIADRLGLALGPSYPEWTEQHFGLAEGMTDAEAESRWPDWNPPEKEPEEQVVARGIRGLGRIHRDFGGRSVIVVAHGTIIRSALASLTGRSSDLYPALDNLATSTALHDGGGWRALDIGGALIADGFARPDRWDGGE